MPGITSDDVIGTNVNYARLARLELDLANRNMGEMSMMTNPKVVAGLAMALLACDRERRMLRAVIEEAGKNNNEPVAQSRALEVLDY